MSHRTNPHRKPNKHADSTPPERAGTEPGGDTAAEASSGSDALQGEGNYTAARRYNSDATDFARSGQVEDAARRARPGSRDEERALDAAEAEGRSHAKEEDPTVARRERH